jgi:NADH-quinone oxidoreductase subunit G
MHFGSDRSRFTDVKRSVEDKNLGPLVKTVMTRCIHCTRCVRFSQEVAGVDMLGTVGRGNAMEIGTYVDAVLNSEMSGNVVDLCPVGALTSKPNAFAARSWEYRSTPSVDVLDGCGPSIKVDTAKGEVMRVQPRLNEDVNEEWISDKTRYAVDGLKRQRLDTPLLRKGGGLEPVTWQEALTVAADKLGSASAAEVGALAGSLVEVEALVCLKDLINGLGSTSTTACSSLSADLRSSYSFNATIAGIEQADALLLVGSNPRVEAPLVNARIRKMVRHASLPVASVGPKADLTFAYDHLGAGAQALSALADGSSPFAKVLKAAERPLVLVGTGALERADGGAIARAARQVAAASGCLTDDWNGYSVLQSSGSAVGALDVGFVPGPTAVGLKDLKVVYLLGADDTPLSEISSDAFVIYQGHHGDAGAQAADLVLPGAAYTEKNATYVNTEGRVQRTARAVDAPGDARDDWAILVALSKILRAPLPYDSLAGVRQRMADIAPHLGKPDSVEPSSKELSTAMLGADGAAAAALDKAPLASSVANFYLTDAVSRASATMARCSQVFGPRV